ncbi:unnamed protein product [Caenorhabditis sp. 36 PRJEB53466]|nr:unnamed protein product [Caenorhabditis sp. 36 PRJEB53466]
MTPTPLPDQSSSLYVPSETDNLNLDPWNLSADQLYGCAHLLHDQANFDPTANSDPLDEQMDFEPNLLVDDYPYKLQSVYSDSLPFDDSDVEEDIAFWRRRVETDPTFQFVANKVRTNRFRGIWQLVLNTMEMEIPIITTCRRLVLLHQKKRAIGKEYTEHLKHLQPQIYGTGELTDEICAAISYFEIAFPPFVF